MLARPLFVAALTLLAAGSVVAPNATAGEPVAVMVAVKGKVTVTPAGATAAQTAVLGRPLEKGDKIAVGGGAGTTLYFNDGNVIELGEKSTITVSGKVAASQKAGPTASVSSDVFKGVTKFVSSGSSRSGLIGLAPMRGGPAESGAMILAPRRTHLATARPGFAWNTLSGATRYRVTLSGDDGVIWSQESKDTTLAFPADKSELASGDYLWELEAFGERGSLRREETVFHVLDPAEAKLVAGHLEQIEKAAADSPEGARFLAGSYLFDRGLYQDAVSNFEALCKLTPEAPGAHEALGNTYRAVGLTDQAAAEYQRALALTRTP